MYIYILYITYIRKIHSFTYRKFHDATVPVPSDRRNSGPHHSHHGLPESQQIIWEYNHDGIFMES